MKVKSVISAGILAAVGLSGCVVSDNPYTNAAATTAAIGVAGMLFYSLSDGYYYDQSYNRMPRDYRPSANIRIHRVNNMDEYRRRHPHGNMNNHYPKQHPAQYHRGNDPRNQMQQHNRNQMQQHNRGQMQQRQPQQRNNSLQWNGREHQPMR